MFSAFAVGQAMSLASDYSKAREASARVFELLDSVPSIDSSSKDGLKPVCRQATFLYFTLSAASVLFCLTEH